MELEELRQRLTLDGTQYFAALDGAAELARDGQVYHRECVVWSAERQR